MEEVGNRISVLISSRQLSNSEFADSIELPRPILSHILSGRNKPSLLVIQKIAQTYMDVNINWLLLGEGEMLISNASLPKEMKTENDLFNVSSPDPTRPVEPTTEQIPVNAIPTRHVDIQKVHSNDQLENIIHYYEDGTFKQFKPR